MFWAMIVTALVVAIVAVAAWVFVIVAVAAWVFVIAPFWVPGRHHGAK